MTGSRVSLSADEARDMVTKIQDKLKQAEEHFQKGISRLQEARQTIYDLHEFEGWKALGYQSWRACVTAEFKTGRSQLYRELAAAIAERDIFEEIGIIKERILRPLAKAEFTKEVRQTLWQVAKIVVGDETKITSGTMQEIIETLSGAIVTGTTEDEEGIQTPIWARMKADALARIVERSRRQQEHIQGTHELLKVLVGVPAISHVEGSGRVFLELTGMISPETRRMLQNPKFSIKLTAWLESIVADAKVS